MLPSSHVYFVIRLLWWQVHSIVLKSLKIHVLLLRCLISLGLICEFQYSTKNTFGTSCMTSACFTVPDTWWTRNTWIFLKKLCYHFVIILLYLPVKYFIKSIHISVANVEGICPPAGFCPSRKKQAAVHSVINWIAFPNVLALFTKCWLLTCCSVRTKGTMVDILLHHMLSNELDGSQISDW